MTLALKKQQKRYNFIENMIAVLYFIAIALPIYGSNNLESYISVPYLKINIIQLLSVVLIVFYIFYERGRIKYSRESQSMLIIVAIYFVVCLAFFTLGIVKGYSYAMTMIKWFIFPLMFFLLFFILCKKGFTLNDFLKLTFYAETVVLVLTVVMYMTREWSFWGIHYFLGNRFGGNYLNVTIITFAYGFYSLYFRKKYINKLVLIIHFTAGVYCLILAQSRTSLILVFVPIIFTIVVGLLMSRNATRFVFGVIVLVAAIIIGWYFFDNLMQSNMDITNRLSRENWFGEGDTFMVRVYTFSYEFNQFLHNPFGLGFGVPFKQFTSYGRLDMEYQGYYCDNAFISLAVYGGIIMVVLYALIYYKTFKGMYLTKKKTNDPLYYYMGFAFLTFIVCSAIISASVIHGFGLAIFFWSFISVVSFENYTQKN